MAWYSSASLIARITKWLLSSRALPRSSAEAANLGTALASPITQSTSLASSLAWRTPAAGACVAPAWRHCDLAIARATAEAKEVPLGASGSFSALPNENRRRSPKAPEPATPNPTLDATHRPWAKSSAGLALRFGQFFAFCRQKLRGKDLAHSAQQRKRRDRLRQKLDVGVEHAVLHDRVLGVSRDVQHLHPRSHRADTLRQFTPAHARHDYVGDQKIDLGLEFFPEQHGLATVLRVEYGVAVAPQDGAVDRSNLLVVFHEQDRLRTSQRALHGRQRMLNLGCAFSARQINPERRPDPGFAVDVDVPVALLHDAEHRRQT